MLDVTLVHTQGNATTMTLPGLEAVRASVPAGRSLPLLAVLARAATEPVILEYIGAAHLRVAIEPC